MKGNMFNLVLLCSWVNTKAASFFQRFLAFVAMAMLMVACDGQERPTQSGLDFLSAQDHGKLEERLKAKGVQKGDAVFVRIFKKEAVLELWMQPRDQQQFVLFHSYPICTYSGTLGPKRAQGDKQAPEGFYSVGKKQLNPNSRFHLSFNLGYPNAYDRAMGYTGDFLMVHGACVSAGCYAMTDRQIEEIYDLVEAALDNGQSFFRVHIFPFHLTQAELSQYKDNEWYSFWQMLEPVYADFEKTHIPPNVEVVDKQYKVCAQQPCV